MGDEVLSKWKKVSPYLTAPDGTIVEEMISPSGRIWMDRNLRAPQVALSYHRFVIGGFLREE